MLDKVKNFLGYVWASPLTLLGVTYAFSFEVLRWYRWHGILGHSMIWIAEKEMPRWLNWLWKGWGGHAIGNVVVLRNQPGEKSTILTHEQRHVEQCMRLGIFQPLVYVVNFLAIKLGCPDSHPYYDNPMEIDARRAAGQVVDVVGVTKKIKEKFEEKNV